MSENQGVGTLIQEECSGGTHGVSYQRGIFE